MTRATAVCRIQEVRAKIQNNKLIICICIFLLMDIRVIRGMQPQPVRRNAMPMLTPCGAQPFEVCLAIMHPPTTVHVHDTEPDLAIYLH